MGGCYGPEGTLSSNGCKECRQARSLSFCIEECPDMTTFFNNRIFLSLLFILTDISFENAEHAEQKLGLSVNVSLRQFRQQKSFLASYRRTSGNKLEQVVDIGLDLMF